MGPVLYDSAVQTFSTGKINFENGTNELLFSYRATSPTTERKSPGELMSRRCMRTTYRPVMRPALHSRRQAPQPTNQPTANANRYHVTSTDRTSKVSMCSPSYHTRQKVTRHFPNFVALQRSLMTVVNVTNRISLRSKKGPTLTFTNY